jgi:hypothetical protein
MPCSSLFDLASNDATALNAGRRHWSKQRALGSPWWPSLQHDLHTTFGSVPTRRREVSTMSRPPAIAVSETDLVLAPLAGANIPHYYLYSYQATDAKCPRQRIAVNTIPTQQVG